VTLQDARYVRTQLETMAKASVHGAYNPTMTTNPHLVSKAIFDWWWHYRGNKRRIPRCTRPGESVAGWCSTPPRQPLQATDLPPDSDFWGGLQRQVESVLSSLSTCGCQSRLRSGRLPP